MSPDPLEILSALMDGEAVAPDVLAAALLAPGAREALVDFAGLRAELGADDSLPSPALHRAMDEVLARRRSYGRPVWRVLQSAAAVVVLALAALGTMSLRTRFYGRGPEEPPQATRIIQFTPGVDWHEEGGPQ
jgi:negative regulator of sigma E activity